VGSYVRELRAIAEVGRTAERAGDLAAGLLPSVVRAFVDPIPRATLGTVAEAMRAVDKNAVAKLASATSALRGSCLVELAKIADRADVLKSAAEYERHRQAIDRMLPTASEVAAQYDRQLRIVESTGPSVAELAALAARKDVLASRPSAAELEARHAMVRGMTEALRPSVAALAARQDVLRQIERVTSAAQFQAAAKAAMWPDLDRFDFPHGRPETRQEPSRLLKNATGLYIWPTGCVLAARWPQPAVVDCEDGGLFQQPARSAAEKSHREIAVDG
jgi:hypothetical protein